MSTEVRGERVTLPRTNTPWCCFMHCASPAEFTITMAGGHEADDATDSCRYHVAELAMSFEGNAVYVASMECE